MDKYAKRKLTKQKRKSQICKVYEIKIDRSHLSKEILNHLYLLFAEAKWFYNYCLSQDKIVNASTTINTVPVKTQNGFEYRVLSVLSGAMKQGIKARIFYNMSSINGLKRKGYKVGKLKFKNRVNSIPLKQFGISGTYYFDKEKSRIKIQKIKQYLRVIGLEQIPHDSEIANAVLIKRNDNFYLNVTTFQNKKIQEISNKSIGVDFGCQTQLTLSNGIKIEFQVPISERLKRLDRKIDKKINGKTGKNRGSKNRRKLQSKRRKLYENLTNKKKDIRNKIVNTITKNYKYVCFQDENIHAWSTGNHGKKIQNSCIGGIIRDLKNKSHTPIMVDKYFPSTQLCPQCGTLNKLKQSERIYKCGCGFIEDRDTKSARCIEIEGMKNLVPMDYRDYKLEENVSSTCFDVLSKISNIKASKISSMSQEATNINYVVGHQTGK